MIYKKKRARLLTAIMAVSMAATVWVAAPAVTSSGNAHAVAGEVYIWFNSSDVRAVHSSVNVGSQRGGFNIKVENTALTSVTWSSRDTSIMTASGDATEGFVTGVKEGVTYLQLRAGTTDSGVFNDETMISVITPISAAAGYLNSTTTPFRRGASTTAWSRGFGPRGLSLTVTGQCGNYYFVRPPDDFVYDDIGAGHGVISNRGSFILKSAVTVPATGVELDETNITLEPGKSRTLKATVLPKIASNQQVTWSSNKVSIAIVDTTGKVTAKKTGNAGITVTTADGAHTASCAVKVLDTGETKPAPSGKIRLSLVETGFGENTVMYTLLKDIKYYKIYKKTSKKGKYKYLGSSQYNVKYTAFSSTDKGLKTGKTVYYKVKGFKTSKGKAVKTSNVLKVKTGKTFLVANAKTNSQISLKWVKIKGATGYEILRATTKNGKYKKVKTVKKVISWINTGLATKKNYYYKSGSHKEIIRKDSQRARQQ